MAAKAAAAAGGGGKIVAAVAREAVGLAFNSCLIVGESVIPTCLKPVAACRIPCGDNLFNSSNDKGAPFSLKPLAPKPLLASADADKSYGALEYGLNTGGTANGTGDPINASTLSNVPARCK